MELKPYQEDGVKWILRRERLKPSGGLLCDEMGLGKTVQMISAIIRNKKKHTLIVVPKSIVQQWEYEINKFSDGSLKVCVYNGPRRKWDPTCDVCVCPYSVLSDFATVEYRWDRVILDEGHEIRNPTSRIFKTALHINAKIRWIVTGTPIFNKLRDFASMCDFIGIPRRKLLSNVDAIREEYVLRRTNTFSSTSTLEFHNVELEMYEPERKLYEKYYEQLFDSRCILEGILRCRQVSTWPGGEKLKTTAKMDTLVAMISRHPTEKTLIFAQFISEMHEIKRRLMEKGTRSCFVLHGNTKDRDSVIEMFKKTPDQGAVFIIQIKTGGVGLNLQEATRVYITQPSWNAATELQAIARAHRLGQTKRVIVKKLMYVQPDMIDTEMTSLQCIKQDICAQVLGGISSTSILKASTESNFAIKFKGLNILDDESETNTNS